MQLTEQEIVRREALEKIKELGINPFPAEKFDVNFRSKDFVTASYKQNLIHKIADIHDVGKVGAEKIVDILLEHKFKIDPLQEYTDLTEFINFDKGTGRDTMSLENYIQEIRVSALGDYMPEKVGEITMAGRFMGQRGPFAKLQDSDGVIQLYLNKKTITQDPDERTKIGQLIKLLHIGDFIGVKGELFSTQTGEVSLKVKDLTFLAKALKTLPIVKRDKDGNVYDEFKDPELRYRQRYVDLTVNPQVRNIFIKRSKVISSMRQYFVEQGWMEVETPVLQPIHGGAAAKPFETHHNTLDMPLFLRIANELYLKRLIVGGFEGVFEFGKMFRNEGMDRTHNPEFTSMEIYVAYKDYIWMMGMVEECLEIVTKAVTGGTEVTYGEHKIDFKGPYTRMTMYESIKHYTDIDVSKMDEPELRDICKKLHIEVDPSMGKGKLIDEIFGEKVEGNLIQPTYITDYPIEMTPLAKKHRTSEGLVERFELFVAGKEIANAYSELNDPIDQRERFVDQLALATRGDEDAMVLDEDFLRALEYGMPPTSGLGIGIDRLTMMLTNQSSIQEVLFFPQMKSETKKNVVTE